MTFSSSPTIEDEYIFLKTSSGKVKGRLLQFSTGKVCEFCAIPYAVPPIKEKRFTRPSPASCVKIASDEIVNKSSIIRAPYQPLIRITDDTFRGLDIWFPDESTFSEDCLHLNVWTPLRVASEVEFLPVLVWLYGGGFETGAANLPIYRGSCLAAYGKIVVVSVTYRVGPFGFLYLPEAGVRGNQGIEDQILALKWVNENITLFGGDPAKVCLVGESAGGVSVCHHLSDPEVWPYFRCVILHSGVLSCPWATIDTDEALQRSRKYADYFLKDGESYVDDKARLQKLRSLTAKELIIPERLAHGVCQWPWLPCFPKTVDTSKPIRPNTPILVGLVDNEGSAFLVAEYPTLLKSPSTLTGTELHALISHAFHYFPCFPHKSSKCFIKAVIDFYGLSEEKNSAKRFPSENLSRLSQAIGNWCIRAASLSWLTKCYEAGHKEIGMITFSHQSSSETIKCWPSWMGTAHGDELEYAFGRPFDEIEGVSQHEYFKCYSEADRQAAKHMLNIWAQFTASPDQLICQITKPLEQNPVIVKIPRFNPVAPMQLVVGEECQIEPVHDFDEMLQFWRKWLPTI